MPKDESIRDHLSKLLRWEDAHVGFDTAVADLSPEFRGARPAGQPHTPWRLLEHLRICQWDILEFIRSADHVSPKFPDGYWPDGDGPPTAPAWDDSIARFRQDLRAMQDLVRDPHTDLLAPIPHGDGQTIFREVVLLADHTAYHLGQLIVVRRLLGAWPPNE